MTSPPVLSKGEEATSSMYRLFLNFICNFLSAWPSFFKTTFPTFFANWQISCSKGEEATSSMYRLFFTSAIIFYQFLQGFYIGNNI